MVHDVKSDDIWCNYAEGIKTWSGKDGPADQNTAYFIASAVNKGPASGSFIPDSNMNQTLSLICDALISKDSPQYNPGTKGSYFETVAKYMRAVELRKNSDQGLAQQLKEANAASIQAADNYDTQYDKYIGRWEKDKVAGEPAGVEFLTWTSQRAPSLFLAQQERDSRAQNVAQLNQQIYGADAAVLTLQQNNLVAARSRILPAEGLNMKVSTRQIDPQVLHTYYEAVMKGTIGSLTPLVDDPKIPAVYTPLWSIDPTFKTTMNEWARVPLDAKDEFNWNIKSDETKQSSWKDLGHKEGGGGFSIGWIQISGGDSKDWNDSSVTNETGSFEIQLSAQRAGLFNVAPGAWDVKQFQKNYPRTTEPVNVAEGAVVPSQLFCASRVKIRVKLTGNKEQVFDKAAKEVQGGKGGIKILGFAIGASAGRTEETNSHESDLVKKDGWYEIRPTLVSGGCSLLAVIGSKFD